MTKAVGRVRRCDRKIYVSHLSLANQPSLFWNGMERPVERFVERDSLLCSPVTHLDGVYMHREQGVYVQKQSSLPAYGVEESTKRKCLNKNKLAVVNGHMRIKGVLNNWHSEKYQALLKLHICCPCRAINMSIGILSVTIQMFYRMLAPHRHQPFVRNFDQWAVERWHC